MFNKETYTKRRAELKKLVGNGVIILFGNNRGRADHVGDRTAVVVSVGDRQTCHFHGDRFNRRRGFILAVVRDYVVTGVRAVQYDIRNGNGLVFADVLVRERARRTADRQFVAEKFILEAHRGEIQRPAPSTRQKAS